MNNQNEINICISYIRNEVDSHVLKFKNNPTALHYSKQRKTVITIGAVLLIIGFIAAVIIETMVINDTTNNNLTPQGYPKTEFLEISAFSYEYGSVFTAILGMFVLIGGIFGMDSKRKEN